MLRLYDITLFLTNLVMLSRLKVLPIIHSTYWKISLKIALWLDRNM